MIELDAVAIGWGLMGPAGVVCLAAILRDRTKLATVAGIIFLAGFLLEVIATEANEIAEEDLALGVQGASIIFTS